MSVDMNKSKTSSSLYETKTLMCKNNCGYYGNSMQYEGYCSICYRKLKTRVHNKPSIVTSLSNIAGSYDDSTSLMTSSQSFNNQFYFDEKM